SPFVGTCAVAADAHNANAHAVATAALRSRLILPSLFVVDQHGALRVDYLQDVHHRRAVARGMARHGDAVAGLDDLFVPLHGTLVAREPVRARELAAPLHVLAVAALDRQ